MLQMDIWCICITLPESISEHWRTQCVHSRKRLEYLREWASADACQWWWVIDFLCILFSFRNPNIRALYSNVHALAVRCVHTQIRNVRQICRIERIYCLAPALVDNMPSISVASSLLLCIYNLYIYSQYYDDATDIFGLLPNKPGARQWIRSIRYIVLKFRFCVHSCFHYMIDNTTAVYYTILYIIAMFWHKSEIILD